MLYRFVYIETKAVYDALPVETLMRLSYLLSVNKPENCFRHSFICCLYRARQSTCLERLRKKNFREVNGSLPFPQSLKVPRGPLRNFFFASFSTLGYRRNDKKKLLSSSRAESTRNKCFPIINANTHGWCNCTWSNFVSFLLPFHAVFYHQRQRSCFSSWNVLLFFDRHVTMTNQRREAKMVTMLQKERKKKLVAANVKEESSIGTRTIIFYLF